MLIKVTNYCSMGCSHCMENSTVAGEHMTRETFTKALNLAARLEVDAWRVCPPIILLSGGEATEHPEFVSMLHEVWDRGLLATLITNGTWLANPALRSEILSRKHKSSAFFYIQVTNDSRFYPTRVPTWISDPRITFIPALNHLIPLGRGKRATESGVLPGRLAPTSFNFRSLTHTYGDVRKAIAFMRLRAVQGHSGSCSPSISATGELVAGETNFCAAIGTVDSTAEEVTRNVLKMGECNRCGLEANLDHEHKLAIGLARIHL